MGSGGPESGLGGRVPSSLGARILRPDEAIATSSSSAAGPSRAPGGRTAPSSSSEPPEIPRAKAEDAMDEDIMDESSQASQESWLNDPELKNYIKDKKTEREKRERTEKVGMKYRGSKKRAKQTISKAEGAAVLAELLRLDDKVADAISKASKATLGKGKGAKAKDEDDEDDADGSAQEEGSTSSPTRSGSTASLPPLATDRRLAALGMRQRRDPAKVEQGTPLTPTAAPRAEPATPSSALHIKKEEDEKPPTSATSSDDEEEFVMLENPRPQPTQPQLKPEPAGASSQQPPGTMAGLSQLPGAEAEMQPPVGALKEDGSSTDDSDEDEGVFLGSLAPQRPSLAKAPATPPPAASASAAPPQPSSDDEEEIILVSTGKRESPEGKVDVKGKERATGWQGWANEHRPRPTFPVAEEQKLIGPLVLDEEKGIEVPAPINRFLRAYQRSGVEFLYACAQQRRGGIIGDDMGLGKTIQVIAFLAAMMGKKGTEAEDEGKRMTALRSGRAGTKEGGAAAPTALLICPASVMSNWARELDTWGYFEHRLLRNDTKVIDDFRKGRLDVLIASHDGAKNHIEKLWDADIGLIFIDEVHIVKNPRSALCVAMQRFVCPLRFGLTGTAIQNSLNEFWTILDWVDRDAFGRLTNWQELVTEPLRRAQSADARPHELANGRLIAEAFVEHLLPPYFLRRTKDIIKDRLPQKEDNIVLCPLADAQLEAYKRILEEEDAELIRRAAEPCCEKRDDEGLPYARSKCCFQANSRGESWNETMLRYFALLSECANHLALVFPDPADNNPDKGERMARYQRQLKMVKDLFEDDWQSRQANDANGFDARLCGKWKVLEGLLKEWHQKGDKVLLFTNKQRLLKWLSHFVEMAGYRHRQLDGSTPQPDRQRYCDEFNNDEKVFIFLISTKAGGTGLNLTGANRVVLFDPNWNPAHDLQAMDRAYRFGQKRDVHVYRLIARGSFEEVIYGRQLAKQQLSAVGYEATEERRIFSGKDDVWSLRALFSLQETSLTKSLIERCDINEVSYELARFAKQADVQRAKGMAKEERKALEDAASGRLQSSSKRAESSSVAAILEKAGVEDVVKHQSLLGGSRAESAISSEARKRTLEESGALGANQRRRVGAVRVKNEGDIQGAMSSQVQVGQQAPPLPWLAEHEGCDLPTFVQRLRQMSDQGQQQYFARAVARWNGGQASRHGRLA